MEMKRRAESEWEILIREQEESGQSQTEWCKSKNINLYTFRDRKSQLRMQGKEIGNKISWVSITETAAEFKNEQIYVKIGKFTISTGENFSETVFMRICKVLAQLC
jgi:hypothetical protein